MTYIESDESAIWKALGDPRRRQILEALSDGPKLTGELVKLCPDIGRTGMLRHIAMLSEYQMITVRADGRKRWNYLNPDPIKAVCNDWIARHIDGMASSAARLKQLAETDDEMKEHRS